MTTIALSLALASLAAGGPSDTLQRSQGSTPAVQAYRRGRALDRLWGAAGDNIFLLKLSYWWNP